MIKIEESLFSNQGIDTQDKEWAEYKIFENDQIIFEVSHSNQSPEKNNLWSNFRDCYNVICLLKRFYNYGLQGKTITFGMRNTR